MNRGLRLDYFVASNDILSGGSRCDVAEVVDGFVLDAITIGVSDHAPVGVTLAV